METSSSSSQSTPLYSWATFLHPSVSLAPPAYAGCLSHTHTWPGADSDFNSDTSHSFFLTWSPQKPFPVVAQLDGTLALRNGGNFICKWNCAEGLDPCCHRTINRKLLCGGEMKNFLKLPPLNTCYDSSFTWDLHNDYHKKLLPRKGSQEGHVIFVKVRYAQ